MRRFLFCVALVVAACGDSTGNDDTPPAVSSVAVDTLTGSIFRALTVTTERAAALEVTYWSDSTPKLRVETDSVRKNQSVFLPRLRASTRYNYEVRSIGTTGIKGTPHTGTLTTGPLPPELAAYRFATSGTATMPLTMIEIMVSRTAFAGVIIVDRDGHVVWFWRGEGGFVNGATRRANGNFVFIDQEHGMKEITPAGRQVRELVQTQTENPYGNIHHDVVATPQNTLWFLARETRPVNGRPVVGEAIWEWAPETNQLKKLWSAFDFLNYLTEQTPSSLPDNWLHANGIQIGPRGSIIVSFRNLDQVISIAPDFKSLDWRLSGPGGTLQIANADRFYGQHSPIEVTPNRVVLFDNGFPRPGAELSSRVIELAIDPVAKTATRVWEFLPNPINRAMRVGSVRRLANGNTVAAFGWGQGSPMVVYELNSAGQVVAQLNIVSGIDRFYRGTPLESIAGEVRVN